MALRTRGGLMGTWWIYLHIPVLAITGNNSGCLLRVPIYLVLISLYL